MRKSLFFSSLLLVSTVALPALASPPASEVVNGFRLGSGGVRCIASLVVLVIVLIASGVSALVRSASAKQPPPGGSYGGQQGWGAGQPPYGGQQGYGPPPNGGQQGYGGGQPPYGGQQAGYGGAPPPYGAQPGYGGGQPPYGGGQPPYGGGQAPYGGEQAQGQGYGPPPGGAPGYPPSQSPYAQAAPKLVCVAGALQGHEFPVGGGVVIGSSGQIVVNDPQIGAQHAWIGPGPNGRILVRDGGTPGGTYVNNQRIGEAELKEQDVVTLGNGALSFSFRTA